MFFLDEEPRKEARIEIIPMIDVMMFLLVFFVLISLNVIPTSGLSTQLPNAKSATTSTAPAKPLIVTVTVDGKLQLNGEDVTPASLKARLSERSHEPEAAVIIKSDGKAEMQKVVNVMDIVRDSGIKKVSIAARKA
ncbi:ExbD/TolR family protein [Paludibacterium paludis]|uniref:Biopolymer transporter ExbD n=1 Tax=Paludibacterium paludis TaxID=1225769 RepID=A0A918U8Y9_9NEIS|nr:biopolymer transporter ExbD [Paludibacterium paludis]GGY11133.1 biopolymer transporter ExbD [Paludibacterium paludis]